MKKWTEEEIEDLYLGLELELSHEEIAECLGRTKSSIMHKVQRLNLAKSSSQWMKNLSKEETIALIQKYKTSEAMDYTEGVPGHKSCQRILGVSSWAKCLEIAGIETKKTAKFDSAKKTCFYIVEFEDIDKKSFRKFGITQRTVQERYSSKNIKIIAQVYSTLDHCLDLEKRFETLVKSRKYMPKNPRFYNSGHGGYTECYI